MATTWKKFTSQKQLTALFLVSAVVEIVHSIMFVLCEYEILFFVVV